MSDEVDIVTAPPADPPLFYCGTREPVAEQIAPWRKRHLTWAITGDLPGLSRDEFRSAVAEALASIQAVCGLTFAEAVAGGSVDILLTTGRIDRAGGVLAWSELPDGSDRQLQQKYDTSDSYVVAIAPPRGKIDLVAVACHELIHAAGLPHSAAGTGDLMEPTYMPGRRKPQPGDIKRLQSLYGLPVAPPPPDDGDLEPAEIRIFTASGKETARFRLERIR